MTSPGLTPPLQVGMHVGVPDRAPSHTARAAYAPPPKAAPQYLSGTGRGMVGLTGFEPEYSQRWT